MFFIESLALPVLLGIVRFILSQYTRRALISTLAQSRRVSKMGTFGTRVTSFVHPHATHRCLHHTILRFGTIFSYFPGCSGILHCLLGVIIHINYSVPNLLGSSSGKIRRAISQQNFKDIWYLDFISWSTAQSESRASSQVRTRGTHWSERDLHR